MSSPTLQSLVDGGCAVNFRCTVCLRGSSWTASSLAELFGPAATLDDLSRRLRCQGDYATRFTCRGAGIAWIIAPNQALGPDGRTTLDEIYRVHYPVYSAAAAMARGEPWPNAATQKSAPGREGQGRA